MRLAMASQRDFKAQVALFLGWFFARRTAAASLASCFVAAGVGGRRSR